MSLAVASVVHEGVKVNFVDTPGHPDFVGEVRAGLRAADAALFVVSAVDGVDGLTRMLWEECASVGMPRAVVVTHLDQQRADFDEALAICQRVFGAGVQPLYLPLLDDDEAPAGLIGLLSQRVFDLSGGTRVEREAEPEHLELIEGARGTLIEGIIQESEDDGLLDRWLAGEEVTFDTLVEDLEKAVARGAFHPVLPVDAARGLGVEELLEVVVRGFPSPLEHPAPTVYTPVGGAREPVVCDPAAPLVAEVVKTTTDPFVGRISVVRIFSGTLVPDADGARVGPLRPVRRRDGAAATRTTTSTSASAPSRRSSGATLTPGRAGRRRRHRGGRPAHPRRDRRHPLGPVGARADGALGDARAAAADGAHREDQRRRGQAVAGARPAGRGGPDAAHRGQPRHPPGGRLVDGRGPPRGAARPAAQAGTASRWAPARSGWRCARPCRRRRRVTAGTSSSPAGTASTPSATSRSSRCRRAAGSSSSTGSSGAPSRGSSSPASRRVFARSWPRGWPRATRWSTSA